MYAIQSGLSQLEIDTPTTFKEAMSGPNKSDWFKAAQKEYDTADRMGTWKIIPRSSLLPGSNVITNKWVFKRKHDALGVPTEFKARITPHGYKQKPGVDYFDTYAQVGMYKTLRLLLTLVAMYDLELEQLDVPSAFLNADLDEDIYMEIPEGFGQDGMVMKLLKALYGLKQGPRCWWILITKFIIDTMKYQQCISDACFFYKKSRTGKMMYLYLFVDDFQSAYHISDVNEWHELKLKLINEFNTKDLGSSVWMLGMRITRDRINHTIILDQETYITKAVERFGMSQVRIISTPEEVGTIKSTSVDNQLSIKPTSVGDSTLIESIIMSTSVDNNKLNTSTSIVDDELELNESTLVDSTSNETSDEITHEYMKIVGTLLYAATSTRLDIAHAVNKLSARIKSPNRGDMVKAQRVLRYLSNHRNIGLRFGGKGKSITDSLLVIEGYSDSDRANDRVDRKSISGWIVKLCGSIINWSSKKQRVVALSTCEAELYALCSVAQEVLWLRGMLSELNLIFESPTTIWCDNQSTVDISKNTIKSERTKHIDTRYYFIVDNVKQGILLPKWISTTEQHADILTKPLSKLLFTKLRNQLMIVT
jgi:hypothetical protein